MPPVKATSAHQVSTTATFDIWSALQFDSSLEREAGTRERIVIRTRNLLHSPNEGKPPFLNYSTEAISCGSSCILVL